MRARRRQSTRENVSESKQSLEKSCGNELIFRGQKVLCGSWGAGLTAHHHISRVDNSMTATVRPRYSRSQCRVGRELWMDPCGRTPGARLGGKLS